MSQVIASETIKVKFLLRERWDVVRRLFQILEEKAGRPLCSQKIADGLLNAGAVPFDDKTPRKNQPQIRLAPMVKDDESHLRFTVYSDDSIVIEPVQEFSL